MGFQDVAGDGQFMGRGAAVRAGVVQNQTVEMDQFTIDPQRGAGIGEVRALEEALADRRAARRSSRPANLAR